MQNGKVFKGCCFLKRTTPHACAGACAREGEAIRAALRAVSWPLRTSAARRRLVAWWTGLRPSIEPPQGGRMAPRGYAPLGIGLGRFLTCGRIQLMRRPVAGPMCSAGYAKNRLRPIFFTLPPHPGVHWTPGQARHRPGEPLVVREGPENRLSERGGVPRSGRITGAGGAQRPQAGLLRLRQGLGTSEGEKAASGPFNRVGRKP